MLNSLSKKQIKGIVNMPSKSEAEKQAERKKRKEVSINNDTVYGSARQHDESVETLDEALTESPKAGSRVKILSSHPNKKWRGKSGTVHSVVSVLNGHIKVDIDGETSKNMEVIHHRHLVQESVEALDEVTYGAPVDRKSSLKGTTPSAPHNETPEAKSHREKGEREAKRKLHYHKHGEWPEEHHESVDLDEEVDLFLDEETGEHYYMEFNEEELNESAPKGRRIVTRVNFKGQRKKVLKCGPGKMIKHVNGNRACVVQSGTYKRKKKLAVRKMQRTKKRKGQGYLRKINVKRQRALRRRKSMGL